MEWCEKKILLGWSWSWSWLLNEENTVGYLTSLFGPVRAKSTDELGSAETQIKSVPTSQARWMRGAIN